MASYEKHIHLFQTQEEFEAVYNTSAYTQPWLSYIEEEDAVGYNKYNTNGHDFVDLGLPSGTLWAKMNVGATSEDDAGDFFSWGEVEPKSDYTLSNYKWYDESNDCFTKYTESDGILSMELEDDAAHANMGGNWRTPNLTQIQELLEYTNARTIFDTNMNKLYTTFTSRINGNKLKFPFAAIRDDEEEEEPTNEGYIMTRTLSWEEDANYLIFSNNGVIDLDARYLGTNVRGVFTP